MFKRVLVANRGEIAIRVMATCKRLGIPTVGIYTPTDKHCKHVSFADKSVELSRMRAASATSTWMRSSMWPAA